MNADPIKRQRSDILIVDDTPANLRLLSQILTEQRLKVRVALNGAWALTTAQAAPPDLILLDIVMPEMDGYEVCRRLKADEQLRDIPILFISALSEVEDKVKGFAVGGVDYITKPFQQVEVLARVRAHLSLRQATVALEEQATTLRQTNEQLQAEISQRQQAEEALRDLITALEQRVAERTAELRAANEHLTELDQMKTEFMSRMSHELRTPLTSIKIYIELLETAKPEKRDKFLQTLKREADRLHALIEDVLTITQLSRDTLDLEFASADLNQVLEPRLAAWQTMAAQRALAFGTDLASPLPTARLDTLRTQQVVALLISNAVSYTPAGSITLATRARVDDAGQWLTVSIADTGPGITPDDLPHIFERFYRGRAAADYKTPGTGVGLSIARQIAEKLGGRLTVETQVGVGSTFTLWLPAASDL